MNPNETDQFLADLPDDQGRDLFDFTQQEPQPFVEQEEEEEPEYQPKNRRERRLLQKAEREKQSSIQLADQVKTLNERIENLSQVRSVADDADYLKAIELIYGNDSPEAIQATELLKKAMIGVRDDAETRAYQRLVEQQTQEVQAVAEAEEELDSILDDIEDRYGVELTEEQEVAYFQLMQKMSPKDRQGNVVALADPDAVWEVFSDRMSKKPDSRAKELSARSMVQSGATKDSTLKDDAAERQLREWGIL